MIRQLADQGKSILVSSHILSELSEMCDRVGIIEQGQLLAVGSVAEIQRRRQPRRTVKVRVLGTLERLAQWLEQRDDVHAVRLDGDLALFTHDGDRDSEVTLLRALVEAGFPVAEFGTHDLSLEDVFLDVTEGHIQ
jgi:ABC-2 type transport system ATP-binding protein